MTRPAKDTCLSSYDLRGIHEPTLPIQSRGGDWMLKAKLPAHARFWNAGGTFADRPAELAHCAARVRLRARSLWLTSGVCGLSLEVTDLPFHEPLMNHPVPLLIQTCQEPSPLGNWGAFAHFSAPKSGDEAVTSW